VYNNDAQSEIRSKLREIVVDNLIYKMYDIFRRADVIRDDTKRKTKGRTM